EGVVLGSANEGEGLTGQDRVGVSRAGLDGQDFYRDVGLGKVVLGHADIHRKIAGAVNRLGDDELTRRRPRDERPRDEDAAQRRARGKELPPVHETSCWVRRSAVIDGCPSAASVPATTPRRT